MRNWQFEAPLWIADAVKDLPPEATLKERRAALNKVAGAFHMGTSWGRRVWSKHARAHLEQHGLPKRTPKDIPPTSKMHRRLEGVTFPFMEEAR